MGDGRGQCRELYQVQEEGDDARVDEVHEHGADDGDDDEGVHRVAVLERPLLHNGHFQDRKVGCSDKARHIRHFAIINVSRIVLGKVAECIRGLR